MLINRNDKKSLTDINLINWIHGFDRVYFASWQRDMTWTVDKISKVVEEILEAATFEDLTDARIDLLNFIAFSDVERIFIADGQSRTMALNLFIRAYNDYLDNHSMHNLPRVKNIEVTYLRDSDDAKYRSFLNTHKTKPYNELYTYIYEQITDWAEYNDIANIRNVINNCILASVVEYTNEEIAMKAFIQINTGGSPLKKEDIIAALIEFYKKKYNTPVPYIEDNLEEAFSGYYYMTVPDDKASFSPNVISNFMEDNIGISKDAFAKFRKYMMIVDRFSKTPWYDTLNLLDRGKTMKVAFALVGKGHNPDDEDSHRLLTNLFAYAVISSTRRSNAGGATSGFYVEMQSMLGANKTPGYVADEFEKWIKKHIETNRISMKEFATGLDRLSNNVHKSILLFVYNQCNRSSTLNLEKIHLEHSYPENPGIAWDGDNWPSTKEEQKKLINCLGNKFLLAGKYNEELGRESISVKTRIYEKFFSEEAALRNTCNYFDGERFAREKMAYAIERRNNYAKFLAATESGKIMVQI